MNAAPTPDPARAESRARRNWFRATGRLAGTAGAWAAALTLLDVGAAIGFAAGLSLALTQSPHGLHAAAPGALLALASGLLRGLLALGAAGAGARAAERVKAAMRARIARAALAARPGTRRPVGESMTMVVEAVEALDGYYARFAPAQRAAGLAPLLVAAAMAVASPVSAAIVLATFVPFVMAMILAGGAAAEESRRQFEALNRLSGLFADRVRALPAVLAFQAEARTTAILSEAARSLSDRTLRVLKIAFISSGALEFFAALSVALVAVYCGFNVLGLLPFPAPEKLTLMRAFFVLALAPEAYAPMRRLAAVYHDRQAAEAVAAPLMAMAAPEPEARDALPHLHDRRAAPPEIRFQDVRVFYPGDERPALEGFNLCIGAGEVVALMGPTGAGKSTALGLLLGLAQAQAGSVTIDGTDLAQAGPLAAGWAGQAPVVMPGSLADNITLSRQDASPAAVAEAARLTGLTHAPGGLERRINERGGGLSGGERRRLGLARALLRDAPVLLLDEPTANLDLASEADLLPVIARAAQGRTTLIATHSEAVAALADRVVRLAA